MPATRLITPTLLLGLVASVGCGNDPARTGTPTTPPPTDPGPTGPPPTTAQPTGGRADAAPIPPPPPGSAALAPVPAATVAPLGLRKLVGGLRRPVALLPAPGDTTRLYIVEQPGRIRVLEGGSLRAEPFYDITGKVSTGNEQGLLGLAFHPGYATNRRLYVNYTDPDKDTHVVEYRASADGLRVDPNTARELLVVDQPYSNHNGGHLAFGPDGKLYVGLGDGGSAGDPLGAGQDLKQKLGKMLRLDVDAPSTAKAPTEIALYGLRNPWRYAFDPATGDLYIGDVGQDQWENVYVVAAGDRLVHNFGWNVSEGAHCFRSKECDQRNFTAPVADYPHAEGCSITGGQVYRGAALPELAGVYFYADYCTGLLRSFRWYRAPDERAGGVIRDHWDWKATLDRDGVLAQVSSFGTDAAGELYVVLLTGSIYQLVRR